MSNVVRYTVNRSTERQRRADPVSWVSASLAQIQCEKMYPKSKVYSNRGRYLCPPCVYAWVCSNYTDTERRGVCNSTREGGAGK